MAFCVRDKLRRSAGSHRRVVAIHRTKADGAGLSAMPSSGVRFGSVRICNVERLELGYAPKHAEESHHAPEGS